jgi:hypothetical protein
MHLSLRPDASAVAVNLNVFRGFSTTFVPMRLRMIAVGLIQSADRHEEGIAQSALTYCEEIIAARESEEDPNELCTGGCGYPNAICECRSEGTAIEVSTSIMTCGSCDRPVPAGEAFTTSYAVNPGTGDTEPILTDCNSCIPIAPGQKAVPAFSSFGFERRTCN